MHPAGHLHSLPRNRTISGPIEGPRGVRYGAQLHTYRYSVLPIVESRGPACLWDRCCESWIFSGTSTAWSTRNLHKLPLPCTGPSNGTLAPGSLPVSSLHHQTALSNFTRTSSSGQRRYCRQQPRRSPPSLHQPSPAQPSQPQHHCGCYFPDPDPRWSPARRIPPRRGPILRWSTRAPPRRTPSPRTPSPRTPSSQPPKPPRPRSLLLCLLPSRESPPPSTPPPTPRLLSLLLPQLP